jgi:RNA polymerase sigma-70 factor (ECF subfamily)
VNDRRGDEAFRAEALRCLDGLYGFAMSLARDRTKAQDLVQETYLRALAARHKAAPEENLRGWLFTILHNVWRNEVRRRRPMPLEDHPACIATLEDPAEGPELALSRCEQKIRVRAAIEALPDAFREVVVLHCIEGFSYRDIANLIGCPAGTVMSRLARGRALLRKRLMEGDHCWESR